ncbi:MAG: trypsin-like peptidase domain-containing protein [Candidatus Dormibacteraeota bacterium]|nr:trypsin-like peptidase domain-containing protein [Candidatus Dormibacteraeota bacterium]
MAGLRRVALLRAAAVVGGLIVAGVVAFAVTAHVTGVGGANVSPTPLPAAATPTASPPSVIDVGRMALSRVVTIEADRTNEEALGTGWLFDGKGDFVTNAHVVAGALTVRITDRRARTHLATVLGSDPTLDVAVVRSADGFSGAPLPVDSAALGPLPIDVVDIASSRATGHDDLTEASLTQTGQDVPLQPGEVQPGSNAPSIYHGMLEISGAKVYQGNSGGPVLDSRGRVLGILTLASPDLPDAFAIPFARIAAEVSQFAGRAG